MFFSHTKPTLATSQPAVFFFHDKLAPATVSRTERLAAAERDPPGDPTRAGGRPCLLNW